MDVAVATRVVDDEPNVIGAGCWIPMEANKFPSTWFCWRRAAIVSVREVS